MSIEGTIAKDVVGEAASVAVSATPLGVFKWLKVGVYAAGVLLVCYLIYRVVSFVEQAATDHAAVQVLTDANAKLVADAAAAELQHAEVARSANASVAAANARAAQTEAYMETLRHAKNCTVADPSLLPLYERLR